MNALKELHKDIIVVPAMYEYQIVTITMGFMSFACRQIHPLFMLLYTKILVFLTHCGLVSPYGDMELSQHWLK